MLGIVVLTTVVMDGLVRKYAEESLAKTQEENAQNLLKATTNNVAMQYYSILYNKEAILNRRKTELRNAIEMAYGVVSEAWRRVQAGEISEEHAREDALKYLRALRYDNGVGYFWVNNTDRGFPTLIMHPTMPEEVGRSMLTPLYNCVKDTRENLFLAMMKICAEKGEGFVEYVWPKPAPGGLTTEKPKISYVKLFKPWNFIIGTGVYIDDIEAESSRRVAAVIKDLQREMKHQRLGDLGYFFIFNNENRMLVHPHIRKTDFSTIQNVETGNILLEELKEAAHSPSKSMEYLWDQPENHGDFIHRKKAFVRHFEPLNWYVAVSVYKEDFEKRVRALTDVVLYLSLLFIGACLLLAIWLARSFSGPVNSLTRAMANTATDGLPAEPVPETGSLEMRSLSRTVNHMVDTIRASNDRIFASEMRFRTIFESAGEAIWLIRTADGVIAEFNTAAYQSLGYTAAEFEELSLADVVIHDDSSELQKYLDVLPSDETLRFESFHRDHNSDRHDVMVTCRSIQFPGNNYNLVFIRDVTEKNRLAEMMIQSEKMLSVGGLAAGIAHEINNPLAGVLQNVELLRNRLLGDLESNAVVAGELGIRLEDLREYAKRRNIHTIVDAISDAGNRGANIVRNMLSFTRKEQNSPQLVDLVSLLDSTVALAANDFDISKQFDFRKIRIVRDYAPDLTPLSCYPCKIQQVILNILKNGADAMKSKQYGDDVPQFTFRVYQTANWFVIEIEDNGPGMSKSVRKRIFEPFFTTRDVGEGTGLGMSVSYFIIVEEHQGRLEVDTSPGEFSRFTIRLPVTT